MPPDIILWCLGAILEGKMRKLKGRIFFQGFTNYAGYEKTFDAIILVGKTTMTIKCDEDDTAYKVVGDKTFLGAYAGKDENNNVTAYWNVVREDTFVGEWIEDGTIYHFTLEIISSV